MMIAIGCPLVGLGAKTGADAGSVANTVAGAGAAAGAAVAVVEALAAGAAASTGFDGAASAWARFFLNQPNMSISRPPLTNLDPANAMPTSSRPKNGQNRESSPLDRHEAD